MPIDLDDDNSVQEQATGATDMNGQQHWIGAYHMGRRPERRGFRASVTRIVLGAAVISAVALPLTIDVDDIALEESVIRAQNAATGAFELAIEDSSPAELGSASRISR